MKISAVIILLCVSFGFVGFYYVYCISRIKNLISVREFIEKIRYYTINENRTFANALSEYIENTDYDICDIAEKCYTGLIENKTLKESWLYAVENSDNLCCRKDRMIMASISDVLGMTDADGQMTSFNTLQNKIEERILLYKNYKEKRMSADCIICISLVMIVSFIIL